MAKVAANVKVNDIIEVTGFNNKTRTGKVTQVQPKSFQLDDGPWFRDSDIKEWKHLHPFDAEPYRVHLGKPTKTEATEVCERIRFALFGKFMVIRVNTNSCIHPKPEYDQDCTDVSIDTSQVKAVLSISYGNHRRDDFTAAAVSIENGVVTISTESEGRIDRCYVYVPKK